MTLSDVSNAVSFCMAESVTPEEYESMLIAIRQVKRSEETLSKWQLLNPKDRIKLTQKASSARKEFNDIADKHAFKVEWDSTIPTVSKGNRRVLIPIPNGFL